MKPENPELLLRDPETEPTDSVLEQALGSEVFPVYRDLMSILADEYSLTPYWRYYKDGKAWLCKVEYKKTVFWLSIWEGMVKISFYFTQKTAPGIFELEITDEIKDRFREANDGKRMIPLTFEISSRNQFDDLVKVILYKKKLK